MSQDVNIKRVQSLSEFNNSINLFCNSTNEQLRQIQNELSQTLEWLAERERTWRQRVQQCQQRLNEAKRAYAACMAQSHRDNSSRPNCSAAASAVHQAEMAVTKAQKELDNVLRWKGVINSKIPAYNGQSSQLRNLVNQTLNQASVFIREKVSILDASSSLKSPVYISSLGGHGYSFQLAKQEMLRRALNDPLISRDIRGWVQQELNRLDQVDRAIAEGRTPPGGNRRFMRMPPGLDAGHRNININTAANLRFEDAWQNRRRPFVARELGIFEMIR